MSTISVTPTTAMDDFVHYLATGEDPRGTLATDLECEFNFPGSSFKTLGKDQLDEMRAQVSDQPWVMRVERVEATPTGFVAMIEYDASQAGVTSTTRTLTLVSTDEHHIIGFAHWCTGQL